MSESSSPRSRYPSPSLPNMTQATAVAILPPPMEHKVALMREDSWKGLKAEVKEVEKQ